MGKKRRDSSSGNESSSANDSISGNEASGVSEKPGGNDGTRASDGSRGNGISCASDMTGGNEQQHADLTLRRLADLYEGIVRVRNAAANRIRAREQGADLDADESIIAEHPLVEKLQEHMAMCQSEMELRLKDHPVYDWIMGVPGINRTLACKIVGLIPMEKEEDFASFSKLRVFAGLCPGRNRLVKGEKACFNMRLKTTLFVAFQNMLKAGAIVRGKKNCPAALYADIYGNWRGVYLERHGEESKEWPKLRQHYGAKNKMLDVFLCHVWRKWREGAGWSIRELYVHERLGHHMNYAAEDFHSERLAKRKIAEHRRAVAA